MPGGPTARILNGGRGDRFLKCTKTEEFSSFIATFRARGNILGRALVGCTYKCTGGVGVQWWSAGAAEIEVKQISPPSDRGRFLAHLGCKGEGLGCALSSFGALCFPFWVSVSLFGVLGVCPSLHKDTERRQFGSFDE